MKTSRLEEDSDIVRGASAVAALAATRAEHAENARTLDREVINALVAAGFTRHFVPTRFGGAGGSLSELMHAAVTVGSRCPATAWCAVLAGLMARVALALPAEGQTLLWSAGPDVFIAGGISPHGTATATDEGWLLSGVWPMVSAAEHSDWVLLAAEVRSADGRADRVCVVPRSAVHVERSWDSVGMAATGSHTVIAEEILVPVAMTFPFARLGEIDEPPIGPDGRTVPLLAVNGLIFTLPMMGAAYGALREWRHSNRAKLVDRATEPAAARILETFARAASEIDAAALILDRVARAADDQSAVLGRAEVARNQRDCAFASDLLLDAVDRLFRVGGTSGRSTGGALQRFWRDIHTAGGHAALRFDTAAAAFAALTIDQ
ncbi:acyl-CoA dehydrogenase family protein [Nocardia sp. NPDC046763]|uniref:acyl-CoA dehydrogenase family protein n=1 Tax=Nocardia sp. NPDC046763 TaxID=3155256 RepID=UPI0033C0EB65